MITNEPSTEPQQTPLPTETAGPLLEPDLRQFGINASAPSEQNPLAVWLDLLRAFGVWIASIVFLVVTQLAVAIPYYGYRWATTGPPELESLTSDKVLAFLSIMSVFPAHLLTLGLIWLVVTQGRKYPFWPTIHFEWPKYLHPAAGFVICSLIATVLFILGATATYFWGGNKTQLDALVESSIAARLATAFIAFFTAPLIEELIYRGVLYAALERGVGKIIAVGIVSLLFAGVHVFQYIDNIAVIAVITMLSFTLTIVRANTGSVLAPFVIHLVFNGIQSIIIALSPFTGWGQTT